MEWRIDVAKAERLPRAVPRLRKGIGWRDMIVGFETETPVIGGITEHEDLGRAGDFKVVEARSHNGGAYSPSLLSRCDGERPQERDLHGLSGNAACREDDMPQHGLVGVRDERHHAR